MIKSDNIKEKFEQITEFEPAFDNETYGKHCVSLRMTLKGKKGAVDFVLYTGWFLPETTNNCKKMFPMPADLGYHSPKPRYKGEKPIRIDCPYVPKGKKCYYGGSTLNADKPYKILVKEGSEALWKFLKEYYEEVFCD